MKTYTITIKGISKDEVEALVAQATDYKEKIIGDVEKTKIVTTAEELPDGAVRADDGTPVSEEYFITGEGSPIEVKYTVQEEIDNPESLTDRTTAIVGGVLNDKFTEFKKIVAHKQVEAQLQAEEQRLSITIK